MRGYLGNSDRQGYKRLYLNNSLTRYLEIREADIVNPQKLAPDDVYPFESTMLWVKWDANISHTSEGSLEMQAQFLGGRISNAYMPSAGGQAPMNIVQGTVMFPRTMLGCVPTL